MTIDENLELIQDFLKLLKYEPQLFQGLDLNQLKFVIKNEENNSHDALAKLILDLSEKYEQIGNALEKCCDRRDLCEEGQPVSPPDPILEAKEITNTMLCHAIEATERKLAEHQPDQPAQENTL